MILGDIARHAKEILDYTHDVEERAFLKDRRLQLMIERLLEIIGEAARQLSAEARTLVDYDWRGVQDLRNVLAHQYGSIDHHLVWNLVRKRIPELLHRVAAELP
jgi:uncharacterized protein with HEPN domain